MRESCALQATTHAKQDDGDCSGRLRLKMDPVTTISRMSCRCAQVEHLRNAGADRSGSGTFGGLVDGGSLVTRGLYKA